MGDSRWGVLGGGGAQCQTLKTSAIDDGINSMYAMREEGECRVKQKK